LERPLLRDIDDLDLVFAKFYANEVNSSRLFSDLRVADALLPWRPLLIECIDSFKENRFLIVVPSLFLIFEGVFSPAVESFKRMVNIKQDSAARLKFAEDGHDTAIWGSVEGFGGEVFRSHSFAEPAPARLNRHWVLHGRSPTNWTRLDCLRLFQAIHTIQSQVQTPTDAVSSDA
jgi:hypothetical protein